MGCYLSLPFFYLSKQIYPPAHTPSSDPERLIFRSPLHPNKILSNDRSDNPDCRHTQNVKHKYSTALLIQQEFVFKIPLMVSCFLATVRNKIKSSGPSAPRSGFVFSNSAISFCFSMLYKSSLQQEAKCR